MEKRKGNADESVIGTVKSGTGQSCKMRTYTYVCIYVRMYVLRARACTHKGRCTICGRFFSSFWIWKGGRLVGSGALVVTLMFRSSAFQIKAFTCLHAVARLTRREWRYPCYCFLPIFFSRLPIYLTKILVVYGTNKRFIVTLLSRR